MSTIVIERTIENEKMLENIFLPTNKNWESSEDIGKEVIESGENGKLFNIIIEAIQQSKRMICLQSFLIQDTKIIDALVDAVDKRGVKVFVMDSAETKLDRLEEDENFIAKEYAEMITNKFRFRFVHRQAKNLHAKFILIDPKTNPVGFLFTGNFNKKPFFENPELAVILEDDQILELFKVFVYHFWEFTTDEQVAKHTFEKVKSARHFERPELNRILVTSPDSELSNLKKNLLEGVNSAQTSIQISTFGFDISHELSQAILEKLKEGLEVTVFCRPRKKSIKSNLSVLAENGAKMFCHPLIHAKSILVDNKAGYIFTANFEKHGMDDGFEVGVPLNKSQVAELVQIYLKWSNSFPFKFYSKFPLSEVKTIYKEFNVEGRLDPITPPESEEKVNERAIKNVNDFIDFFATWKKPSGSDSKKYLLKRKAKFSKLEYPIKKKVEISKSIFNISYEKKVLKKNKEITTTGNAVLIEGSSKINYTNLEEYLAILIGIDSKNLEIYIQ